MADVEKAIRGLHEIAIYITDSCGMIRAKEYVKKMISLMSFISLMPLELSNTLIFMIP